MNGTCMGAPRRLGALCSIIAIVAAWASSGPSVAGEAGPKPAAQPAPAALVGERWHRPLRPAELRATLATLLDVDPRTVAAPAGLADLPARTRAQAHVPQRLPAGWDTTIEAYVSAAVARAGDGAHHRWRMDCGEGDGAVAIVAIETLAGDGAVSSPELRFAAGVGATGGWVRASSDGGLCTIALPTTAPGLWRVAARVRAEPVAPGGDTRTASLRVAVQGLPPADRLCPETAGVVEATLALAAGGARIDVRAAQDAPSERLAIDWIELEGPLGDGGRRAWLRALGGTDRASRDRALADLLRRALRRPCSPQEETQFSAAFDGPGGVQGALSRLLATPAFLYLERRQDDGAAAEPITLWELASRCSYAFLGAPPPRDLIEIAERGGTARDLHARLWRLIGADRGDAFAAGFGAHWLGMDLSPVEDESVARLRSEVRRHIAAAIGPRIPQEIAGKASKHIEQIWTPAMIADLLAGRRCEVNERQAAFYGLRTVHGAWFRSIVAPPRARRGSLFTTALVLRRAHETATGDPAGWICVTAFGPEAGPRFRDDVAAAMTRYAPDGRLLDVADSAPDLHATLARSVDVFASQVRRELFRYTGAGEPPGPTGATTKGAKSPTTIAQIIDEILTCPAWMRKQ